MTTIEEMTEQVVRFRDARDWKQFHTAKDMLIGLLTEVGELAELMKWQSDLEISEQAKGSPSLFEDELADILYWVLLLSHDLGLDLSKAFLAKMEQNASKYPVSKARGSRQKYSNL